MEISEGSGILMTIGETIRRLRAANKLTQEELAAQCGVSTQAVQKWESDSYAPSLEKLILLSKQFNISLDALVLGNDARTVEEQSKACLLPDYEQLEDWEAYVEKLDVEYTQLMQEGRDVAAYKQLFEQISHMPRGEYKARMADVLFDLSASLPMAADYPYVEPSDLEGIRVTWAKDAPEDQTTAIPALREHIAGAWYGRICGCLLGKTIEGIRTHELLPLLRASGNYPMTRYIRRTDVTEDILRTTNFPLRGRCYADELTCMPADDDTNYVVLNQELIEKYGRDFTPMDVGRMWLSKQSIYSYFTAERVAFRNIVRGYAPPASALNKNPFREWIGAQIRADYFAYINPGRPAAAAEMAWRDASISHVKNGIYGEMWAAALIALAAVCKNVQEAIYASLKFIPQQSRLHEHLLFVVRDYEEKLPQEECFAHIHARWDEKQDHDWCHTISNAEIVAAALLYGEEDYGKSICMAVQTGFDTDCNGATVGSVIGMCHGMGAIDPVWLKPVSGGLETGIFGLAKVNVEERIDMTMRHIEG